MKNRIIIAVTFVAATVAMLVGPLLHGQTPATAPSTQPAAGAQVTPEARTVLDALAAAYGNLKSFQLAGTVQSNFDVDGQKGNQKGEFTASFQSPNRFRHEIPNELLIGSTGQNIYIYQPVRKLYMTAEVAGEKINLEEVPSDVPQILHGQNPSLLLALVGETDKQLIDDATAVTIVQDVTVGDQAFTALNIDTPQADFVILVDKQTNLIRRVTTDLTGFFKTQGAQNINAAELTVDYTQTIPNGTVEEAQFAWAPPEGAKNVADAPQGRSDDNQPSALEGKPAPDFKLAALDDDKEVALADLKGSVTVLDFWATWCGPCVASLPELDKLNQDMSAQGVKIFAVNLQEDKEKVQGFINSKKLTLPVLLDTQGNAGNAYGVQAIPMTIVIGKDGTVRKVFVGSGHGEELRKEVEGALKAG